MKIHRSIVWLSITPVLTIAGAGRASPITFAYTQGSRSASATFDTIGNDLIVTMANTTSNDVMVPIDVLTAVFFDVQGAPLTLTRTSALLGSGSTVHFGPAPSGGVVGGEFAYRAGLVGAPHSAAYGMSAAGFGLFGPGDVFPGPNLSGTGSPNGLEFGLLSAGDNPATGNSPVTGGDGPLIRNEVVFRLSGLPSGFDPSASITNVSFQYGTGLGEPNIPAPGAFTALLLAGGLIRRRRR